MWQTNMQSHMCTLRLTPQRTQPDPLPGTATNTEYQTSEDTGLATRHVNRMDTSHGETNDQLTIDSGRNKIERLDVLFYLDHIMVSTIGLST